MKIIIASGNKGKIAEVERFFPKAQVISQKEIIGYIEPEENGTTFAENAQIKAKALYVMSNGKMAKDDIILADDSGILIPALGCNSLGVYTKRQMEEWTKKNEQDEIDFWNYCVDKAGKGSLAEFKASIAVVTSEGEVYIFEEVINGSLVYARGTNGFGFDPIFEIKGKTFGEMSADEKQLYSPRAKALDKVKQKFEV